MFEYDVKCDACQKVIGKADFVEQPSEEKIRQSTTGYICDDCMLLGGEE